MLVFSLKFLVKNQIFYGFQSRNDRFCVTFEHNIFRAFGEVMLVHSDRLDARGEQILHNEFALKVIRFPECDYHKIIREVNTHTLCRHHDNVLFIGSIYCQTFQQGLRVQARLLKNCFMMILENACFS